LNAPVTSGSHIWRKLDRPAFAILLAAILFFGAWIRITGPLVKTRSPDERYYMDYAGNVAADPVDAPSALVAGYNDNPQNWFYPIPLRIGFYYPVAGVMKLCHTTPERAGVAVSTAASIAQLAFVALFGLRFFNRWTALTALALLSVSPHDLAIARRVWCDGLAGSVAMILVWLCAEISVRSRATLWYAAFWFSSAWFFLIKESGGVFFGFCIAALLVQSWRRHRSWQRIGGILAGAIVAALCSFLGMAILCGGVAAALDNVRHNIQGLPNNTYLYSNQEGPWYSLPLGLWVLSPLTAAGFTIALITLFLPRKSLRDILALNGPQNTIVIGLGALILMTITLATCSLGLKNLRYISFIVGPWYLMAALGLTYIALRLRSLCNQHGRAPVTAALVLLLLSSCWSDYARYREIVVRREIPDLDIRDVETYPFDRAS
jgi:hypothetical protein